MEKNDIPEAVLKEAERAGTSPVYSGIIDGSQIYSLLDTEPDIDTPEGLPVPTGLPVFLSYKDGKVSFIGGLEGLRILGRLNGEPD